LESVVTDVAANADDTNIVSWKVSGTRYDVDLHDIDGVEWRDIGRVTGLTQPAAMRQALVLKEFDCIGAFIWVWRRRAEPDLKYEDVLRSLTYRTFEPLEDEPTDPPA
jgi:hypothetical protein